MLCSGWSCRRPRYLQRCPGRVESSPVTSPVHMFVCGFPQNLSITFHYYGRGYNLRGLETAFGAKSVISKCTHHHHHRVMARITGIIDRFEAVIDLSTFVGDRNMISRLDNGQCIDSRHTPSPTRLLQLIIMLIADDDDELRGKVTAESHFNPARSLFYY